MTKRVAMWAFRGEQSWYFHALINAVDMKEKGIEVALIIEGQATRLIGELVAEDNPLHSLYVKVKGAGLIKAVCKGCANMMGTLEVAEEEGLPVSGELKNHVPLSDYILKDFEFITF